MSVQEFQMYWHVIRKRLWLICVMVGATLGVILLMSYLAAPSYKATVYFQVTAPLPAEVSLFSEFRTSTARDELIYTRNNFMTVLQSEYVAWKVIDKLGLNLTAEELIARLVLVPDQNNDFVTLSVAADSAASAAAIANTTVEMAVQYFGELNAATITSNREFIEQQLQKTEADLTAAGNKLIQFQLKHAIGSFDGLVTSQERLISEAKANRDLALAQGKTDTAAAFDQIIAEREKELQDRILLNAEYGTLQAEAKRIDDTYTNLRNTETEATLKENEILNARFIQVVPAQEPSQPLPRYNPQQVAVAGLVSLVVGVILAFLLEAFSISMPTVLATGKEKDEVAATREQPIHSPAK